MSYCSAACRETVRFTTSDSRCGSVGDDGGVCDAVAEVAIVLPDSVTWLASPLHTRQKSDSQFTNPTTVDAVYLIFMSRTFTIGP